VIIRKETKNDPNGAGDLKVISKIGADEGYTLILQKNENMVFFASKSIDLNDQIIKSFDLKKN